MEREEGIFFENICFVPVVHGRLEFALAVLRWFARWRPDAVAVEFPGTLQEPLLRGLKRLPLLSVILYEEKDGTNVYLPLEPTDGAVEAARLGTTHGIPVSFIDGDLEGMPRIHEPLPDPYSVQRIGHTAYCMAYAASAASHEGRREDILREATMAYQLQRLAGRHERVLFVCGLSHFPRILERLKTRQAQPIGRQHRDGIVLAHLHERSSREIMAEIPYLAGSYERQREALLTLWRGDPEAPAPLDRLQEYERLLQEACQQHLRNAKEEVPPQQLRILRQFARNYALTQGFLAPDLYQLIVAARGAMDDNFAYEVWDLGSRYPFQQASPELPSVELHGEDLLLNQKRIRFYRHFRVMRRRLLLVPAKQRWLRDGNADEWRRRWRGLMMCSYPPEDLVVEGWGHYVKKKAGKILAAENSRTFPFTTSLLDGVDIRETIRNWHEGKLYVREDRPLPGKVGSVVLIFDEDLGEGGKAERFPWRVTLLGEHEQEY